MKTRTPKKNKSDILKSFLYSEKDLNPRINESFFNRFFELIEQSLSKHQIIELINFGIFKIKLIQPKYD